MAPNRRGREEQTSGGESAGETAHVGRRGGKTTMTGSMVRKTFWIDQDTEDALRRHAEVSGIPESELFRQALRRHYGIEEP